jgi:hypothetical protein
MMDGNGSALGMDRLMNCEQSNRGICILEKKKSLVALSCQ